MMKKWSRRKLCLFFERLELYLAAGLTIDRVLLILIEGERKADVETIRKILNSVESGALLSKSLARNIRLSESFIGLIEQGELSGNLIESVKNARLLLEREDELIKKCLSAMFYPIIIGGFSLILTIGLIRGVMPQIIPMLQSLHVKLPLLTKIVISLSDFIINYGFISLVSLVFLISVFTFLIRKSKKVRRLVQQLLLSIPILGSFIYLYSLTVLLRSFGALVQSGLSIPWAFSKTVNTISLLPLKYRLLSKTDDVERGMSVGNAISVKGLPIFISQLLNAGESSGNLGNSISHAAHILDRDLERSLRKFTALVEPLMLMFMGIIVAGIALSIMLPIYDIGKNLHQG